MLTLSLALSSAFTSPSVGLQHALVTSSATYRAGVSPQCKQSDFPMSGSRREWLTQASASAAASLVLTFSGAAEAKTYTGAYTEKQFNKVYADNKVEKAKPFETPQPSPASVNAAEAGKAWEAKKLAAKEKADENYKKGQERVMQAKAEREQKEAAAQEQRASERARVLARNAEASRQCRFGPGCNNPTGNAATRVAEAPAPAAETPPPATEAM